jgi:hypothetical protein
MNQQIIEAVKQVAIADAEVFFNEFQSPLDPATTDWDGVSWGESQSVVTDLDRTADPGDYWQIYDDALVAETERLTEEYDRTFEIEGEGWSTQIKEYEYDRDYQFNFRLPQLRLISEDYSSDLEGIVDEPVSHQVVRKALTENHPDLAFEFGDWDAAEYPYLVCRVTVRRLTEREKLVLQIAV